MYIESFLGTSKGLAWWYPLLRGVPTSHERAGSLGLRDCHRLLGDQSMLPSHSDVELRFQRCQKNAFPLFDTQVLCNTSDPAAQHFPTVTPAPGGSAAQRPPSPLQWTRRGSFRSAAGGRPFCGRGVRCVHTMSLDVSDSTRPIISYNITML